MCTVMLDGIYLDYTNDEAISRPTRQQQVMADMPPMNGDVICGH